ncbi:DUF6764 family protein [Rhodococcus sp. ARC_M6]|uniref:DUF6764 family protein n=1 Tax=Rhodococcus sp. ARC_M6 TaxID=2928852 RepID=UPI001FB2A6C4|nr:DUF6764 family protein [Rhodococcus sp. ARC_M6]MCJ0902311.1 hypothetical protein [Rhodococcus sp. ARC_M6]
MPLISSVWSRRSFSRGNGSASNRLGGRLARTGAVLTVGMGLAAGLALTGAGAASAAPVTCASPPATNDIQVSETASCGAQSVGAGRSQAGAMESGTAVSVSTDNGYSNSYANGFGTALGASRGNGQAHAYALGGGIARAGAADGNVTLAIAGWGAGATSDANGVNCMGTLSFAVNFTNGQFCIAG